MDFNSILLSVLTLVIGGLVFFVKRAISTWDKLYKCEKQVNQRIWKP